MNAKCFFICLCLVASRLMAAETPQDSAKYPVTGNFALDLFGMRSVSPVPVALQDQSFSSPSPSRKSPWLAGGLSLVLPGAGEFYTEDYWKSAGFLVVEVAMWALAYYWDNQGNRQTNSFQDYADAHWSVVRYVQRALANFKPKDASGNPFTESEFWSGTPNANAPWVGVNWDMIHQMESAIGNYYSHNLAPHGDQQYYEMIGKYEQFNMGWDDANPSLDPSYQSQKANLTARFLYYGGERAKANTYFGHATTFVTVALLNHVLSAVDGALSATWYNKAHASLGFRTVPDGVGYVSVPVLQLRYDF